VWCLRDEQQYFPAFFIFSQSRKEVENKRGGRVVGSAEEGRYTNTQIIRR